jgi:hypothetical protein
MVDITAESTSSPRPFVEVLGLWLKVFKMDEAFFAEEARRTSRANTLYGVLISTVTTVVVFFVQNLRISPAQYERLAPDFPWVRFFQFLPLVYLVLIPMSYYLGVGLQHLAARLFKGNGNYTVLIYLVSLFCVPLGMVAELVSFIPCAGALISLGIGVYEIILTVRVFRATYGLSTGKALGAFFLPDVVLFVIFVPVCVVATIIATGPGLYGIFHNVMQFQGIGTPAP